VKRRTFIAGLGSAAAWPVLAKAQQAGKVWRIGFLASGSRPDSIESSQYGGFRQGMSELGLVEGKDFVIEWRFAEGRSELFPGLAAELVRAQVDIVVAGTSVSVRPVQQASSTLPIVMAHSTDPVGDGLVASLARPGGNVTGLATSADATASKQLELLAKAVPKLSRVGFLSSSEVVPSVPIIRAAQAAAAAAGLQLLPVEARNLQDFESTFATLAKERVQALMVGAVFNAQRQRLAELSLRARLPTIGTADEFVEAGGLMSYGESAREFNRRAARPAGPAADALPPYHQPKDRRHPRPDYPIGITRAVR
jgi:putative ABC transport system substrate-binding protein